MKYLTIIVMILLLTAVVFAQVDTLQLIEINSIEVPGDITEIYTETIFIDNKELFICTNDHIYVIDSQTNDPVWSLNGITNPRNLQFEDINNDGFIDLVFRDEFNIRIYDIINDYHIWSSPTLDSTYSCYAIGHRNDDNWIDIAIANQVPTDASTNFDTVWIALFDGPEYTSVIESFILMTNYYDGNPLSGNHVIEYPTNIEIMKITYENSLHPFLIISSYYYHSFWDINDPPGGGTISRTGNSYLMDGFSFQILNSFSSGRTLYIDTFSESDSAYFLSLTDVKFCDYGCLSSCDTEKFVNRFSVDTMSSDLLWGIYDVESQDIYPDWQGYLIDDLNSINSCDEICYAFKDSLFMYSFPDYYNLWFTTVPEESLQVISRIESQQFFESSNVLCKLYLSNKYSFFNGNDGSLSAIILNADQNTISAIDDLNNDLEDEILSFQNNCLRINHLDYATDINGPIALSYHTFLQPNYPNPFNSSTTINYILSSSSYVTLDIYDILGRRVHTLYEGTQPAGSYSIIWNADGSSSGVYFYKLTAGDFAESRKMILTK